MGNGIEQTFAAIHHQAISEVLHLLDGFYENLEHGLFELAFHIDDQCMQGRCAETMKDLRLQKTQVIRKFTKLMEADRALWLTSSSNQAPNEEVLVTVRSLAQKHKSHFGTALRSIVRNTALASDLSEAELEFPFGPERLAYHFFRCVAEGRDDPELSSMLYDLFSRLVLGRLGSLYGRINLQLIRFTESQADPEIEVA